MKITYLFPIFSDDNAKTFFDNFLKSDFFKTHQNYTVLLYVSSKDKKNFDYVKKLSSRERFYVFVTDKEFNYNDAFVHAINNTKSDVLLLGDLKVANIDMLFAKCIEKYKDGANIVHVVKRKNGAKKFFYQIQKGVVGPLISFYTGKNEKFNQPSLGLIDANIIDILCVLPHKASFLKNTNSFYGFSSRTIFIDDNVPTYKENFRAMTFPLRLSITGIVGVLLSLILIIFGNIFFAKNNPLFNVFMILLIIFFILLIFLFVPKHFMEIRSKTNKEVKFERYMKIKK